MRRRSEHPFKAERIRHGLSQLKRMRRLVRVEHQIEKICEEDRNHDWAEVIRHPDQAHEGHDVEEAFHELPVVHGANSGNEPEHGCHARTRQAFHVGGNVDGTARRRSRGKSIAHSLSQTVLTEHGSADIADTCGTQWLPAGAAVSHCGNIVVRGAVHTSLLVVITDTANGFCGPDASTGWFSSRL